MATILIADDERDILEVVKYNLQKEGYNVLTAGNGILALELAARLPDLILLDIMMPGKNGIDVIKEIKKNSKTSQIPVIFLTAKGTEIDEVLGLELGADDYIVKPISMPKLIARVKNVLRKHDNTVTPRIIRIGAIEIVPSEHIVRVGGKEVFFPKKEFEILRFLASKPEIVVNRETLLKSIWGADVYVIDRTIDVHIRKIREKLGGYSDYIETIKGIGYRMRGQK